MWPLLFNEECVSVDAPDLKSIASPVLITQPTHGLQAL